MAKSKTFVLHDESVNTYGFRMLTSGVNLDEFRKNPVMLLNHNDYSLPIGRWENIRIDGGKILADAVFDEKDERAAEVMRKVDNDFIRMASIGAWPPEEKSDAYSLMLPGQRYPTVTKWTVREASIVTIGANHNALAFYDKNTQEVIDLTVAGAIVRLMDNSPKTLNMSLLTQKLNLHDTANEAEIVSAVQNLMDDNARLKSENKTLTDAIDKVNADRDAANKAEAVRLVDAAILTGRLDAKAKEATLAMFDKDFESTKAILDAITKRQSIARQINSTGTGTANLADLKGKSWDELDKANKLTELKDKAPEIYAEKFKERFGVDPKI
ncbi:hypothetical protein [Muribaculum gordoncarteri]|uniref:hypothetical protein n=1 Tax=Muribaculum gordoncarteri TaxID=2530390 RepID=UPI003F66B531